MENPRVLVVDDDKDIATALRAYLTRDGMEVGFAHDGEAALAQAQKGWDLVLLDVMMPKYDGFEVCRLLREQGIDIPILFLTARSEEIDQVLGLGLGADDYITKPFSPAAVVARVKAHLRRYKRINQHHEHKQVLRFGNLTLDLRACQVYRGDQPITLTAKEFELLRFFAEHKGQVLTREQIFVHVWGEYYMGDDNTVTVHIRRLREKIEDNPAQPGYIKTVRGLGYRFDGGVA